MKILVTGAAGFIGFHVSRRLLDRGDEVTGLDNVNPYYDVALKEARLDQLRQAPAFTFVRASLEDQQAVVSAFEKRSCDAVVHLAAQAGVRYSIQNPRAYVDSNVVGFLNVLEAARVHEIRHLVYASTSSI